jgi:uncharacterized protein (TIGR02391 family)
MNVTEAITDLWKEGYFQQHRVKKDIDAVLLKEKKVTCSNISVLLKDAGFLRRDKAGWIQRRPFSHEENVRDKNLPNIFELLDIHPRIAKVSKRLFSDKYYAQAVFEAFKCVNIMVKQKSGKTELDGKPLMLTVFSRNNPVLKLNSLLNTSEKDEQEGYMHLFAGAMIGIRNPKGHENIKLKDTSRAVELLVFASLLAKKVDASKK